MLLITYLYHIKYHINYNYLMELSTDLKELAMGKSKSHEETYKILVGKRLIKDTTIAKK